MDLLTGIGALILEFILGLIEGIIAPIIEGIFGAAE